MNLIASLAAASALASDLPAGAIQLDAEELVWKDGPASLPPGTRAAVLEGDPRAEGIFTMRLELPARWALPAHTHPAAERITVLQGSVWVGLGPRPEKQRARRIKAGGFYVTPSGVPHALWTDEKAILQLTGTGPWGIAYLDPRQDPRAATPSKP